jgi:hypothetical protein
MFVTFSTTDTKLIAMQIFRVRTVRFVAVMFFAVVHNDAFDFPD